MRSIGQLIDDLAMTISPSWGYRRKMFRQAETQLSTFRGADKSRLKSSWNPGGGSADEDLHTDLPTLRERCRDLLRNNPHASAIVNTELVNVISTGIRPQSRIDGQKLGLSDEKVKEMRTRAEGYFARWSKFADAQERHDFYGLQALVYLSYYVNGDVLLNLPRIDLPWKTGNLAIEVIEADRLTTPDDMAEDWYTRDGVQMNEYGRVKTYHVRTVHPGENTFGGPKSSSESTPIPARNRFGQPNAILLYRQTRPGQTRGVPELSPVISFLDDLDRYEAAELVAARMAACFGLIIETADPFAAATGKGTSTANSQRLQSFEPGMVHYASGNEKYNFLNPQRPSGTFGQFTRHLLESVSSAVNIPYILTSKDFSSVNYSSARAALLQFYRYCAMKQEWFIAQFLQPIWELVIEEAYLAGELGPIPEEQFYANFAGYASCQWYPDTWEWIDPLKEVTARREAVASNLMTLADACDGDWQDVLRQRSLEEQERERLGLASILPRGNKPMDEAVNRQMAEAAVES